MSGNIAQSYDSILILDFGSQYSHLITRRVRELGVYCELQPCTIKISELTFQPKAIILSGGPSSVYEAGAPHADSAVWGLNVPILGICYGLQEIAWTLGGEVQPHDKREYGDASVTQVPLGADAHNSLFEGLPSDLKVWMSHGDQLSKIPPGFEVCGKTTTAPYCAIVNESKKIYGIQFHPEVTHTPLGKEILRNFAVKIAGCATNWTMESFIDKEIERIRALVGPTGEVVGAVSGGVDSTVAACLMTRAIGSRFHAILVDHGLMRLNECDEVKATLKERMGINLTVVDAQEYFLSRLVGVSDPEKKRKIIGNAFIEIFQDEAKKLGGVEWLLQGTLYPDVIESISYKGPSATIKTHHNVGGLLANMHLKLIEPLRELFKDEVRALGTILGLHESLIWRHPFPGPGLAIRIIGEVTSEQIRMARHADHIFIEEIRNAGLYRKISQAYVAVLPVKSVGVMGDNRTYEQVCSVRAVETSDFMTADWYPIPYEVLKKVSTRIINEVRGINRVLYDISSKPPATIEFE